MVIMALNVFIIDDIKTSVLLIFVGHGTVSPSLMNERVVSVDIGVDDVARSFLFVINRPFL